MYLVWEIGKTRPFPVNLTRASRERLSPQASAQLMVRGQGDQQNGQLFGIGATENP